MSDKFVSQLDVDNPAHADIEALGGYPVEKYWVISLPGMEPYKIYETKKKMYVYPGMEATRWDVEEYPRPFAPGAKVRIVCPEALRVHRHGYPGLDGFDGEMMALAGKVVTIGRVVILYEYPNLVTYIRENSLCPCPGYMYSVRESGNRPGPGRPNFTRRWFSISNFMWSGTMFDPLGMVECDCEGLEMVKGQVIGHRMLCPRRQA